MPTQTIQPASTENPLHAYSWTPQPKAERLVQDLVEDFLRRSPFAVRVRDRMYAEAGVRFADLVHAIYLGDSEELQTWAREAGYVLCDDREATRYTHPGGLFPLIVPQTGPRPIMDVTIRVESIADFSSVWHSGDYFTCQCPPLAPVRWLVVDRHDNCELSIIERHGDLGIRHGWGGTVPQARDVLIAAESLRMRPRTRGEEDGFEQANRRIEESMAVLGVDYTCDLFFAAERDYWQQRNRAGAAQKARQDRIGIGWANHDHHTYRSSRRHFARLISIFEKLGFHCRERFYAGLQAGWGAQVLEQPNAGIVIFADVDLSPDELLVDFAHEPLEDQPKLGTVGLWCALHGESFLEAGMHHLECQFDFEALRKQLEAEAGIRTMKPFTDFPYLRQAFTEGERWPVREERIARLLERGQITAEQAAGFREQGAIGSHLENLERNQGFKGFNQTGVSEIISATDPRKHVIGA